MEADNYLGGKLRIILADSEVLVPWFPLPNSAMALSVSIYCKNCRVDLHGTLDDSSR